MVTHWSLFIYYNYQTSSLWSIAETNNQNEPKTKETNKKAQRLTEDTVAES